MCDHGDDVNSSNACGMPSVTMALSVSPPAHNHHTSRVWERMVYYLLNHADNIQKPAKPHQTVFSA